MRVLIDYRPALRDPSGVGESTRQLVKALVASPVDRSHASTNGNSLTLTLFSSSWSDRLTLPDELRGTEVIDRHIPVRVLNFAWHRLGWPPAETVTGRAFDVVHSPHPLLLPARDAAQVVTIYDLYFLDHPEQTQGTVQRDYASLVRDHAHRADRIVTASTFTAQAIQHRLGIAAERIAVCPLGAPDWPARTTPPPDGYVLFVGTLEPRKNVSGLLDAYERLLESRTSGGRTDTRRGHATPDLVLAGGATDAARPWLDRISRPPLSGHVRHLGYVNPSDLHRLYAGARLLVLPSFDEGFGLPVLEAMTVGVPVVASSRGALPEVVGDAGLLVDPDDPAALAAAMTRMIDEDAYADSCVAAGIRRAGTFRWQHTASLVKDAYQHAIDQHRGSREGRH